MTGRTYRIGEAARLLKLEGYVLRFWETEFEQLRPLRTPKGQRLYSDADLVVLRRIRTLLHEKGPGAFSNGNAPSPATERPGQARKTCSAMWKAN